MRDTLAYQVVIRQSELLAEAAHERLVREASQSSAQRRFTHRLLAWSGERMIATGKVLRERFGRGRREVPISRSRAEVI